MFRSNDVITQLYASPQGLGFFTLRLVCNYKGTTEGFETLLNHLKRENVIRSANAKWYLTEAEKKNIKLKQDVVKKENKAKLAASKRLKRDRERKRVLYMEKKNDHLSEIKKSVRKDYKIKIETLKRMSEIEKDSIGKTLRMIIKDLELIAKSSKRAGI